MEGRKEVVKLFFERMLKRAELGLEEDSLNRLIPEQVQSVIDCFREVFQDLFEEFDEIERSVQESLSKRPVDKTLLLGAAGRSWISILCTAFNIKMRTRVFYIPEEELLEADILDGDVVEVVKKGKVGLELGYSSSDSLVGVVSVSLVELKDYVSLPILDLLECNVGAYAGYGRISKDRDNVLEGEFDYGVSATLINLKW